MTRTIAVVVFASFILAALPAAAQDTGNAFTTAPEPAVATHHPLSVDLGLGPAISLNGGDPAFRLVESINYHFSGTDEGFHLGLGLGQLFPPGAFVFEITPRVGWDFKFPLSGNIALGIDPFLGLGLAIFTVSMGSAAAFQIYTGADVKLFFGDMFYVYLRPLSFDILIHDTTGAAYDLLVGFGARF